MVRTVVDSPTQGYEEPVTPHIADTGSRRLSLSPIQRDSFKKFNSQLPVSRESGEEDLDVRELLRRAYSAGHVSPTCYDV